MLWNRIKYVRLCMRRTIWPSCVLYELHTQMHGIGCQLKYAVVLLAVPTPHKILWPLNRFLNCLIWLKVANREVCCF